MRGDSEHQHDRSLAHPIETARDLEELIHAQNRLVDVLEREQQRRTETEALLAGQTINGVLFSGAVRLLEDAQSGLWIGKKTSFHVPFAALTIEDANEQGPLLVTTDLAETMTYQGEGTGRWLVPRGARRTIPISGRQFAITAIAPPAYTSVLKAPAWASTDIGAIGSATVVSAPTTGALRVLNAWLTLSAAGSAPTLYLQGSDSTVVLGLEGVDNFAIVDTYGGSGQTIADASSLELVLSGTAAIGRCGVEYDVVSTTGPRLVYVTAHTAPVAPSS